jgi:hypothetical protein
VPVAATAPADEQSLAQGSPTEPAPTPQPALDRAVETVGRQVLVPDPKPARVPPSPALPSTIAGSIRPAPVTEPAPAPPTPRQTPTARELPASPAAKLVTSSSAAAPTGASAALDPMGSPLGLGLGRVRVLLEGPRSKVTDQSTESVSGKITAGTAERLVLHVNDTTQEVALDGRSFQTAVALAPGLNRLRAVVSAAGGAQAEDVVEIEYVPRPAASGIVLVSPRDGFALGPDDPPLIVVEGQVEDRSATEVWVVANDRRIPVTARDGRFRQIVPVLGPTTRVWAEARPDGGSLRRSETVTVHAAGSRPGVGLLVMEWPPEAAGARVDVGATWRAAPGRLDVPAVPVSLKPFRGSPDGPLPEAFSFGNIKPGVYTFTVSTPDPVAGASVRPTLYLPENGTVRRHVLKPISLAGPRRSVVARVLLPEGVLWEKDDWFTGKSESVDTITKFRFPEGTTWVERKGDPA